MDTLQPNSSSTSPQTVKRVKNAILQEAKSEEKYVKDILKDLTHTEKVEHKAEKEASKAELALESSKKQEQSALKDVYRAENKHNVVVAEIVQVRNDLQYLTHSKRAEQRVANKFETLEELEKQEQAVLKNVYRAEHKHNVAIANVEQARKALQSSFRHHDIAKNVLQRKASYADDVLAKHDENTHTRNVKLTTLRGPSATTEAGRVILGS
ncbi:hypothetical protein CVT25_010887 [Psilocybe cyanescens]|uniref:Uncharacterized protein n=1 Tax=Psilocybe cyanescens TaxID=93625 RepID=A0A409WFM5_PSICY|nr:hypothetical protein CVT25_010887 [Psilocybe cyanescens]